MAHTMTQDAEDQMDDGGASTLIIPKPAVEQAVERIKTEGTDDWAGALARYVRRWTREGYTYSGCRHQIEQVVAEDGEIPAIDSERVVQKATGV